MTPNQIRGIGQAVEDLVREAIAVDPTYHYAETPEARREREREIREIAERAYGDSV